MRRIALSIMLTAFFCLAFLAACGDQKEAKKSETEVTSMDVKKEAKEAMEATEAETNQPRNSRIDATGFQASSGALGGR